MQMLFLLAAAYVFEPVVVSGQKVAQIFGINDHKQTMVTTDVSSGTYHNGTFTPLPTPPGGIQVAGTGINDEGVIVGAATPTGAATPEQGFVLNGTTYTLFSRPGWDNTEARAISNSGLITGYSFSSDFTQSAGFIYDPATSTFTDATPPGSTRTIVQGMNAAGQICGDGRQKGLGRYAFDWQQNDSQEKRQQSVHFLARVVVADTGSAARGINDDGLIAGFTISGETTFGFVGSAQRGFQLLRPPGANDAGATTVCEGLNNAAQVVCAVTDAAGNVHAFIGTPRGGGDGDDNR